MKNDPRTHEVFGTTRVLVVEPDPQMLGSRGAVYGWRVRDAETDKVLYDAHDRVPCEAYVQGFEGGVIEGRYGVRTPTA